MNEEKGLPDWVVYPENEWQRIEPEAAGIDGPGLRHFLEGLDVRAAEFGGEDHSNGKWGAVLTRGGYMLHSWGDPDYRAQTCFDNATRANLGGLTHPERVFLGLALLHRYKNKREGLFEAYYALLSDEELQEAEVLGKAMRFGSMLWMSDVSKEDGASLGWDGKAKRLSLRMAPDVAPLYGEVAESRFKSLARALNADDMQVEID